jgi:hypothetical protein
MSFHMTKRDLAQLSRIAQTVQAGETFIPGHSGKAQYETKAEATTDTFRAYLCDTCHIT